MNSDNRPTIRGLLKCTAIATALVCGTPAVAADPSFTFMFPAGTACSFELLIEGWGGNRQLKEFTDDSGNIVRSLEAGTGTALRFTNVANSKDFSTKSNGAVSHITYNADGSSLQKLTGHNILILFPSDDPPGPSTSLITGRLVFTVGTDGVFTVQSVSGTTTDICAELS